MSISPERGFGQESLRRYTLPLAALAGLGLALLLPSNPRLENALNLAFPGRLDPSIVVVGIDDASLRDYGRLDIWPRELYAQALNNLREAGAKVVGLDVLLSDPAQGNQQLLLSFDQPNLVRSVTAEDYFSGPRLISPSGLSVLNAPVVQGISEVQTAYPVDHQPVLVPSFAAQVARVAGKALLASTRPWLMPYVPADDVLTKSISFRDIVNGRFLYGDMQNRTVVIGVTASGLGNILLPDIDGRPVPGVILQARAISALLGRPFERLPRWMTLLACVLVGSVVVLARGYWGFVIAAAALLLSLLGWHDRLVIPGVTISLVAIIGSALVAFEQWWIARKISQRDPLTGVGNRLALSRSLERRWALREQQPVTVLLAEVNDLRRVSDQYGRLASESVLRELAQRLQQTAGREDAIFRWAPEEFAVIIHPGSVQNPGALASRYQRACEGLRYGDLSLTTNIGAARSGPDTPTPGDLLETASRHRYRLKYEREHRQPGR